MKEKIENNRRVIEGGFRAESVNPLTDEQAAEWAQRGEQHYVGQNYDVPRIEQGENVGINMFNKVLIYFAYFLLLFLVLDFGILYYNLSNSASLEREKCSHDYKENKCGSLTSDDGSELRNYCLQKLKCIKSNQVLFQDILIKYIRNLFKNIFEGISIWYSFIIIVFTLFVIKFFKIRY